MRIHRVHPWVPTGLILLLRLGLLRTQFRTASPEAAAAELAGIREPNAFIVDDVAFVRPEHGDAVAAEVERRRVRKQYYLETRSDVLLRNTDVFERWTRLGLRYMFLGMAAIAAEELDLYRKRVSPDENFHALETARKPAINVAMAVPAAAAAAVAVVVLSRSPVLCGDTGPAENADPVSHGETDAPQARGG